ncbi:VOC family protein [Flexivirga meconopsidis]|uniref:VOC family protein n=1 Tax=Flexivirga meconopsidis TaxID=2977121 RepID=UPI0022404216|nr:VOC family protein [Flexivirga meconopsidis]
MTTTEHTYPAGVPAWIDTEQPDVDAALDFYGGLFGWTFEERPTGGDDRYLIARLDGADVAGVGSALTDGAPRWHVYVATDDAAASLDNAVAAGATVGHRPVQIGPAGTWAEFVDPQGAALRLWQAGRRLGAQAVNVPGAWNFNDLRTDDQKSAIDWYSSLFGWEGMPGDDPATMLRRPGYGEHLAATTYPDIYEVQKHAPEGFADAIGWVGPRKGAEPTRWATTFAVADRDATAARAAELGATVLDSHDTEWTKVADLRDPHGALLTVSQFSPTSEW